MSEGSKRTTVGGIVGGLVGYEVTLLVFCLPLFPDSNLRVLPAVFFGGPIGLAAGIVVGLRLAGNRR